MTPTFCRILLSVFIYNCVLMQAPATTTNTVDISSQANFTWAGQVSVPGDITGIYLPGAPTGLVTLGGINFNIASNSMGNQAWSAQVAAGGGSGQVSVTTLVGVYGVSDVYTLINSMWGLPGPSSDASLIFTGSGGASYSYPLVGNVDIRNWVPGGDGPTWTFGGSTTNVYSGPAYWGGFTGVLDMQHIVLPAAFANQTLTTIQLVDSGNTGVQRTVLDGVTVVSTGTGAPSLTITYSGNQAIVSWPSPSTGFTLQTNGNLATGTWVNYGGTVGDNGTIKTETNSPPTGTLFFRLKQ